MEVTIQRGRTGLLEINGAGAVMRGDPWLMVNAQGTTGNTEGCRAEACCSSQPLYQLILRFSALILTNQSIVVFR